MAAGSGNRCTGNTETGCTKNPYQSERYNVTSKKWKSIDDYPFQSEKTTAVFGYMPVVFYHDAYYFFGGTSEWSYGQILRGRPYKPQPTIARLDYATSAWTLAGELVVGRSGHVAFFNGAEFMIIGGRTHSPAQIPWDMIQNIDDTVLSETCRLNHQTGQINCVTTKPALNGYFSPEIFFTDNDFCQL